MVLYEINLATNRQLKIMLHNERNSLNAPKSSLSLSFSVISLRRLELPLPFSHDNVPLAFHQRTPICKSSPRGPDHPYQSDMAHIVPTTLRNPQYCIPAGRCRASSAGLSSVSSAMWQAAKKANSAFGGRDGTILSNDRHLPW